MCTARFGAMPPAEPLLTGLGCVTTTQEALVTNQIRPTGNDYPSSRSIHPVDATSG